MIPEIRKKRIRSISWDHTSCENVQECSDAKGIFLSDNMALHLCEVAPYRFPHSQTDFAVKVPFLRVTLPSLSLDSLPSRN